MLRVKLSTTNSVSNEYAEHDNVRVCRNMYCPLRIVYSPLHNDMPISSASEPADAYHVCRVLFQHRCKDSYRNMSEDDLFSVFTPNIYLLYSWYVI
jgi:hypothetical protein